MFILDIISVPLTTSFEGVLFILISAAVIVSFRPFRGKSEASWMMLLCFISLMLMGVARILEGVLGGWIFPILEDTFIATGGLFLTRFIYLFPKHDQPGQAFVAQVLLGSIVFIMWFCMAADIFTAIQGESSRLGLHRNFAFFMPSVIVIAITCSIRRCLYYAQHASPPAVSGSGPGATLSQAITALIRPPNEPSNAHRNFALALSVGLLQLLAVISSLTTIGEQYVQYMYAIGGVLITACLALAYYSHSLERVKFTGKLVGVSLTGLLIYSGIMGINSIMSVHDRQIAPISSEFQSLKQGFLQDGSFTLLPESRASYIASWPEPENSGLAEIVFHYGSNDIQSKALSTVPELGGIFSGRTKEVRPIKRLSPIDSGYYRFYFYSAPRWYEVGFPLMDYAEPVIAEVRRQISYVVVGSLFVVVFFPLFFRHHLFTPLNSLQQGMERAEAGNLDSTVPVRFTDEIGAITRSFNQLVETLHSANLHRDKFHAELLKSNEQMESRVKERTRELSEAVQQLRLAKDEAAQAATLEERHRLARDLHDVISQSLYGVMLFARASLDAQEEGNEAKLRASLDEIEHGSQQALKEMRLLLLQLRPISMEEGGLAAALERRFNNVERRLGIQVALEIDASVSLQRKFEDTLYLIATEALNNSLRHSNSELVKVRLDTQADTIRLLVEDEGDGFDLSATTPGMGRSNMHERAGLMGGTLTIDTEAGKGTRVCLAFPKQLAEVHYG